MMLPVIDIVEVGHRRRQHCLDRCSGRLQGRPAQCRLCPGPVCYGNGGTEPTITDANSCSDGSTQQFLRRADDAGCRSGAPGHRKQDRRPLGLTVEEAALGILKIADTKMSLAVREVSVQKGYDPRDFVMVARGGAGPLHAASVARELAVPTRHHPRTARHFFRARDADDRHPSRLCAHPDCRDRQDRAGAVWKGV